MVSLFPERCAVVVPIRRFTDAKRRLAAILTASERESLARSMATRVIQAANGLPVVVVTDDDAVAEWATLHRTAVVRDSDRAGGLNAAIQQGIDFARNNNASTAIVIHADIPLASALDRFAPAEERDSPMPLRATIVPDARYDGTNLLVVPTNTEMRFQYGPGSFALHHRELVRLGYEITIRPDARLGADVDTPSDLSTALAAGLWPIHSTRLPSTA